MSFTRLISAILAFSVSVCDAGTLTTGFGTGSMMTTFGTGTFRPTFVPPAGFAAISAAHTAINSLDSAQITTASIDTTGSTLLVAVVTYYSPGGFTSFSDSKSNTWSHLNDYTQDSLNRVSIYYVANGTVGTLHTFSVNASGNCYCGVAVQGFSGNAASPFDVQNGATDPSASVLATGSVTPSTDNQLLIAGFSQGINGTMTIDNSFTITDQVNWNANGYGVALAYKINTGGAGTGVNPSWTNGGGASSVCADIATFKTP